MIAQGDNLGWRKMEADQCFDYTQPDAHPPGCDQTGLKLPIMHYDNCTARPAELPGHLGHRRLHLSRREHGLGRQVHLRRLVEVLRRP